MFACSPKNITCGTFAELTSHIFAVFTLPLRTNTRLCLTHPSAAVVGFPAANLRIQLLRPEETEKVMENENKSRATGGRGGAAGFQGGVSLPSRGSDGTQGRTPVATSNAVKCSNVCVYFCACRCLPSFDTRRVVKRSQNFPSRRTFYSLLSPTLCSRDAN